MSHEHDDHIDIEIIKELKKKDNSKILLVSHRPNLEKILETNNIPFQTFKPNKIFNLENNIKIYGFFNKERDSSFNYVDSSCIIFDDECSIYHGNDHFIDINHLDCTIKNLGINKIDYLMFGFAYVNWYPFCLKVKNSTIKKEAYEKSKKNLDYGVEMVEKIDARFYIPNGASMVHYTDYNSMINTYAGNPLSFYEYYKKLNKSKNVIPMTPGTVILNKEERVLNNNIKSAYEKENIKKAISLFNKKRKRKKETQKDTQEKILKIVEKRVQVAIEKYKPVVSNFIIESFDKQNFLIISLKNNKASVEARSSYTCNLKEFYKITFIDEESSDFYFKNIYNIEALTGGRRIILERNPEPLKYCKSSWYFLHSL